MSEGHAFRRVWLPANKIVFEEGHAGEEAYLIRRGKVEIRKGSMSGAPTVVAALGQNEIFGELALIDYSPRTATAIATEPTEVVAISRSEFQRRLETVDPTVKGVIKVLCKRFRHMTRDASTPRDEVNWADWRRAPRKPKFRISQTS
tara:strand:- start:6888 stop:7328 length:441 start_codon:yes stop_codon:yes gene_type:complete